MPPPVKGTRSMNLTLVGLVVIVLSIFTLAYTNRGAVTRAFSKGGRGLEASAGGAAEGGGGSPSKVEGEPEDSPRPNCGIPPAPSDAAAKCKAEQSAAFLADPEGVWGNKGYDRVRGALFNRYDGRPFFPRSRHITFLSVGAHFGDILDRYGALGRGPRLDDRIILVEPHPHTIQRLKGRIRLDHRLLLMPAAAHNFDGEAWFEYEKKHGEQGGSGRVTKVMPANATASEVEGLGAKVRVITIDTLMRKMKGAIDYIFMDADTHEPYIFEGMKDTLKRTRIVIFSCHSKWGASGSTTTLFDVVRDVFKPAGMTVSLLGEKRNLLLDEAVVPPELAAKLPDWGFCMATHTSPPITRKVEEHTRMMVGGDAWEGPCGQYFANLGAGSCNGGLLDTLDGVESPDFSKPKEQLAPVYY